MLANNFVQLIGNLGTDPEVKELGTNTLVKVSLATSKKWQDKTTNEWKEITIWHKLDIWGHQVNRARMLKKGDRIMAQGEIHYSSSGEGSEKKYFTSIRISKFFKLERVEVNSSDPFTSAKSNTIGQGETTPPEEKAIPDDLPF